MSMSIIQKNCKACGDLIDVRLADHKRGWGNFCDKRCSAAFKLGERPRSINDYHVSCVTGGWAFDRYHEFQKKYKDGRPPAALPIKKQLGKRVKVTPKYHSPAKCSSCGEPINGPGKCDACTDIDIEGAGWDAHKTWSTQ